MRVVTLGTYIDNILEYTDVAQKEDVEIVLPSGKSLFLTAPKEKK